MAEVLPTFNPVRFAYRDRNEGVVYFWLYDAWAVCDG